MKNYILKISSLFVIFLVLSCNNEDFTGSSTLTPNSVSASIKQANGAAVPSSIVTNEEAKEWTFTVTLSQMQVVDTHIDGSIVSGNLELGTDIAVSSLVIPAYSTTGTITVSILDDNIAEDKESGVLKFEGTGNVSVPATKINITINADYCSFNVDEYAGDYEIVQDDWADYGKGQVVPVTVVDGNIRILSTNNPYINNAATSYIEVTPIIEEGSESVSLTAASNEPFDYGVLIPVAGTGSIDACTKTLDISLNFPPYASGQHFIIKKK